MREHRMRATGRSPASDAASASVVNHRTRSRYCAWVRCVHPVGSTHWTHKACTVQRSMLRPISLRTAFYSRDFFKLFIGAIENIRFIFSKAPNSNELGGEKIFFSFVYFILRHLDEPDLFLNMGLILFMQNRYIVCQTINDAARGIIVPNTILSKRSSSLC